MPNLVTRCFKFIRDLPRRASPKWPRPFWTPWKADISAAERGIFERYGETVIAMQVSGSFDQNVEHARDWLTERTRSRQRHERITFALEIAVVLLILGEILLALWQGHLQSLNFNDQQKVLTNLQDSSAATAKTLASLQSATESMNTTLQMQLEAAKKSTAQAERSAKAGEASAATASQTLHVSERAYMSVEVGVTSIPKVGEKLGFLAYFANSGRTPALDVVTRVRSGIVLASDTAEHSRSVAFGPSVPIPYTGKGTIQAGGKAQTSWQSAPLSQADLDGLTTHGMTLYVFADVTYKDEFNRPHRTNYCSFFDPTTNTLLRCGSLNDAN